MLLWCFRGGSFYKRHLPSTPHPTLPPFAEANIKRLQLSNSFPQHFSKATALEIEYCTFNRLSGMVLNRLQN